MCVGERGDDESPPIFHIRVAGPGYKGYHEVFRLSDAEASICHPSTQDRVQGSVMLLKGLFQEPTAAGSDVQQPVTKTKSTPPVDHRGAVLRRSVRRKAPVDAYQPSQVIRPEVSSVHALKAAAKAPPAKRKRANCVPRARKTARLQVSPSEAKQKTSKRAKKKPKKVETPQAAYRGKTIPKPDLEHSSQALIHMQKQLLDAEAKQQIATMEASVQKQFSSLLVEQLQQGHQYSIDLVRAARGGGPAPVRVCAGCGLELQAKWKRCPQC